MQGFFVGQHYVKNCEIYLILLGKIKFCDERLKPVNWIQSKHLLMVTLLSLSANVYLSGELVLFLNCTFKILTRSKVSEENILQNGILWRIGLLNRIS